MKFKNMLCLLSLCLSTSLFAGNIHHHPKANPKDSNLSVKRMAAPRYCEVEIINNTPKNIEVSVVYNDGTQTDFPVYSYDDPHYIDLFYDGMCSQRAYLTMFDSHHSMFFSDYVFSNETIFVSDYLYR